MTTEGVTDLVVPVVPIVPDPEMIPKSEFEKVMKDLHKHKTRARELEEKQKADETKKLTEAAQYKELYEREKKEREDLTTKFESNTKASVNTQKYYALKDACMKLNLKAEAASDLEKLVDLDQIQTETTDTGITRVLNADAVAERLKLSRPHWFGAGKAARLNVESPGVIEGQQVTVNDVLAAEEKYMKSRTDADQAAYTAILKRFQAQSRK